MFQYWKYNDSLPSINFIMRTVFSVMFLIFSEYGHSLPTSGGDMIEDDQIGIPDDPFLVSFDKDEHEVVEI